MYVKFNSFVLECSKPSVGYDQRVEGSPRKNSCLAGRAGHIWSACSHPAEWTKRMSLYVFVAVSLVCLVESLCLPTFTRLLTNLQSDCFIVNMNTKAVAWNSIYWRLDDFRFDVVCETDSTMSLICGSVSQCAPSRFWWLQFCLDRIHCDIVVGYETTKRRRATGHTYCW